MYKAELRCTKCPIICTNQTGRSNLYCNGAIECEYQRATIEWDGLAAQKKDEAPETIDNNKSEQCCDNPNICFYGLNETKCYNCGEIFSK